MNRRDFFNRMSGFAAFLSGGVMSLFFLCKGKKDTVLSLKSDEPVNLIKPSPIGDCDCWSNDGDCWCTPHSWTIDSASVVISDGEGNALDLVQNMK